MRTLDRFTAKIEVNASGCWIWLGCVDKESGYGRFNGGDGKTYWAHRWSYENIGKHESVPLLHHRCHVRRCVNHEHLEPTTPKEHPDARPMLNSLKQACPFGHRYTRENTFICKNGSRACRACQANRAHKYYWSNREEINRKRKTATGAAKP